MNLNHAQHHVLHISLLLTLYLITQRLQNMIKEEFLQPLPLRLGSPQQVFVDVEFINQQGVLNAMHHHTDLQQNEAQKLNFRSTSTLHYRIRLQPPEPSVTMELIRTWQK